MCSSEPRLCERQPPNGDKLFSCPSDILLCGGTVKYLCRSKLVNESARFLFFVINSIPVAVLPTVEAGKINRSVAILTKYLKSYGHKKVPIRCPMYITKTMLKNATGATSRYTRSTDPFVLRGGGSLGKSLLLSAYFS